MKEKHLKHTHYDYKAMVGIQVVINNSEKYKFLIKAQIISYSMQKDQVLK